MLHLGHIPSSSIAEFVGPRNGGGYRLKYDKEQGNR